MHTGSTLEESLDAHFSQSHQDSSEHPLCTGLVTGILKGDALESWVWLARANEHGNKIKSGSCGSSGSDGVT